MFSGDRETVPMQKIGENEENSISEVALALIGEITSTKCLQCIKYDNL